MATKKETQPRREKVSIREWILSIATLVSVAASYQSLRISSESLKLNQEAKSEERYNQKPELGMTLSTADVDATHNGMRFAITFQNIGHRKAMELHTTSYLVKKTGQGKSQLGAPIKSSVAELGVGIYSTYRYPVLKTQEVKYLLTIVTYKDPVLNKTFTQKFVRKWHQNELVIPAIREQSQVLALAGIRAQGNELQPL